MLLSGNIRNRIYKQLIASRCALGEQLRGDVHNEARVSLAVSSREGGGDEAEVCSQVRGVLMIIDF